MKLTPWSFVWWKMTKNTLTKGLTFSNWLKVVVKVYTLPPIIMEVENGSLQYILSFHLGWFSTSMIMGERVSKFGSLPATTWPRQDREEPDAACGSLRAGLNSVLCIYICIFAYKHIQMYTYIYTYIYMYIIGMLFRVRVTTTRRRLFHFYRPKSDSWNISCGCDGICAGSQAEH